MNPRLFEHYKRELQHVREMGGEFAAEYPKIAGRLGLETLECADPYVERLLEGFAFLAARVQLKIETSHAQLARHLLEMVYPGSLAPTPSMVVIEFQPSMREGSLAQGFVVERGTRLRSQTAPDERTECDFRTAHDVTLWPLVIKGLEVLPSAAAVRATGADCPQEVRSGLALDIETVNGQLMSELPLDSLSFYLAGSDNTGARLYEQMFRHTRQIAVVAAGAECRSPTRGPALQRQGFADDEALLPVTARSFQGYRLVQEYFAFAERFQFAKVTGLASRVRRVEHPMLRLVFLFDNLDESLNEYLQPDSFRLHCVPAINLFPKSTDRIHLDRAQHEYHVVPDRTRPMDFEVHSILAVEGFGSSQADRQGFYPFYSVNEKRRQSGAFYSVEREPRQLSSRQKRRGPRASYIGSEVFLSLVDANEAPWRSELRQLAVDTLCTNRDLPLQMPVGKKNTDFKLDIGAPVDAIRCLAGPTVPRPSRARQRDAWRLVSNLNLNYLSIDGGEDGTAAAALLRQMLELYTDDQRGSDHRQLEGILSVVTRPAVRQRVLRSHVEIAHGLEITVRLDDAAFQGTGAYLLGSVLERFFTRYASINSFTETVLETTQRNEIERWPVELGQRGVL